MRLVNLTFLSIFCLAAWAQAPGTRGHSATMHPPSAHLGAGVVEVTPERAKALKLPAPIGVEVVNVEQNSPAARAGLKTSDVILEINKEKVESLDQFIGIIVGGTPGMKFAMVIWREGGKRTLTTSLEPQRALGISIFSESPLAAQGFDIIPLPTPMIGIEGEPLTAQLAQYFGVEDGVLVRTVNPRTPAERAGLKAGDIIMKVNGTPVGSPREISAQLRPGRKPMVFTVMRNHKEITLNVELALLFGPWFHRAEPKQAGLDAEPDGLYLACLRVR